MYMYIYQHIKEITKSVVLSIQAFYYVFARKYSYFVKKILPKLLIDDTNHFDNGNKLSFKCEISHFVNYYTGLKSINFPKLETDPLYDIHSCGENLLVKKSKSKFN